VTLRRKFLVYLIILHAVFAGCAVFFLRAIPVGLIIVEAFFVISFVVGLKLLHRFFTPISLIRSGSHYLREQDFMTRFTATGQPDMDQLVEVYNHMADRLREERIRSEEQEHLLQRVIENSPGGIITLDVDGLVTSVNPAAQKLIGRKEIDLVGLSLEGLGNPFARQLAGLSRDEGRLLTLYGRRRVRCQAAEFMDRGFTRRFLLLDELTQELHENEKAAYEKLIRMMSHEVNNTSGAVQSLLQSCLAYGRQLADGDREDFRRALEVAITRTANLDSFMSGFAEVVRLPRPRLQLSDPWEIARQVGLLFRDSCEKAGITWREEVAPGLSEVMCDPVQMEQVFVNLVKNAIQAIGSKEKAGNTPREIVLRGGHEARGTFLALRDTGHGLADDVQAQLFTPFFTTRKEGQGLGLTMVQEILLAHGFEFTFENIAGSANSGGAEFIIVF
jgi:nitrogen fixation/metabolism regulation signal transduction histidine kinase